MDSVEAPKSLNFIEAMVEQDLRDGHVVAFKRVSPEQRLPAHRACKAICIDFGIAEKYKVYVTC